MSFRYNCQYEIDDKNGREEFSCTEWSKKEHSLMLEEGIIFNWGGGIQNIGVGSSP